MKENVSVSLLLGFLLLTALCAITPAHSQTGRTGPGDNPDVLRDGVVAWVNNEIILASEVMDRIRPRLKLYADRLSQRQFQQQKRHEFMKELSQMIEEKVIKQAAHKEGIRVSEREIQQEMEKTVKRIGSRDKFINTLRESGLTLEDWKRNKRVKKLQNKLFRKEFRGAGLDTFISPREIRQYYNNHREKYFREAKVKGHILSIPIDREGGEKKALNMGREILKQLQTGADIEMLIDLYSQRYTTPNRTFDWIRQGSFHRKVDHVLFDKLSVSEVSEPILLSDRVVIVKLEGKIEGKQQPFSSPNVQKDIRNHLRTRKLNKHLKKVRRKLIEEAYIKPRFLIQNIYG